jgi:hypothetical protein
MTLLSRLNRIAELADNEYKRLYEQHREELKATGFVYAEASNMRDLMLTVCEYRREGKSLDLGCGLATWSLMAVAAGYDAYACDINPLLTASARSIYRQARREGIIPDQRIFRVATGNMFLPQYWASYRSFAGDGGKSRLFPGEIQMPTDQNSTPPAFRKNAYAKLGITPKDADVIYCWPWGTQEPFIADYLNQEAKAGAMVALYGREGERLRAERLIHGDGRMWHQHTIQVMSEDRGPRPEEIEEALAENRRKAPVAGACADFFNMQALDTIMARIKRARSMADQYAEQNPEHPASPSV